MAKYYYQRCSTQLRILDDGTVTTKNEGNLKGNFSWNNTWDKALPTWGLIDGGDKDYNFAANKITDEDAGIYTKTYEVRIAKSYIAKTAGCEVADVRVMPFWIWFYTNLCFCAPMTDDMAVEIFENKIGAYLPSDVHTYWFLVCDEAPEGYEEAEGLHDHQFDDGVITTEPTHLAPGIKTYTCTDCGATYTETLDKLTEHEYGSWGKHNATQHIRFCECGSIDYADHTWNDGIITIPATQTTTGVKTYTCLDCGETSLKVIDKLGASDGTTEDETDTDVDAEVTTTSSTTGATETGVATTNAATAAEATMIVPVADYGCSGSILGGGAAMISIASMLGVAVATKRKKED